MSTPGSPVPLTSVDEAKIIDYLSSELDESMIPHRELEDKLSKWQDAYDGKPLSPRKDFPWPGAANIVIPLIGIAVDSIVARVVNTIFSVEPFWSVRPLRKEVEQAAKPIEGFLEWSRQSEFNIYAECRKWVPEVVKYGWGYMKVPWEVKTNRVFEIGPSGGPEPRDEIIRRPNPHFVPLRDMITQAGMEEEFQQAEWIAHRFRLPDGCLRWREHDGLYADVDDILNFKEDDHERRTTSGGFVPRQKLNTLYEVWARIPPFGNSRLPENLVLTYHRPKRKILRAIYNPTYTGRRLFSKAKFIEREGELEGQGIATRLADMQAEITTIHCQQVDNATLANTRFFIGKRGVIRPGTKIWPGRFLTVPNPKEDIVPMQLGEVYSSMNRLSTEILAFSERASGVSDPFLGRESSVVGTRATATGTLAILQEGNRRFDLNVRDIRDSLSDVGRMVLELNQQFRPKGVAYFVQGEEGQMTEVMLDLPREFLVSRLAVELTASTATINRAVEQQGLINLLGLLSQYYQQNLQIAMLISNPDLPPSVRQFATQMTEGAKYIMQRLLQTFDVKNIDAVLPTFMMEAMSNGNVPFGAGAPVAGNQQVGGMGALLGSSPEPEAGAGNGGLGSY